jgi:exonuclease SbcD
MRIAHTSDWHLGRSFCAVPLVDDQARVLFEQVFGILREHRADALIIAGDIYDRAIPPTDAVRLFDEFLTRLSVDLGIPVLAVAGNHDGPDRLAFGSRLLESRKIYIRGALDRLEDPVVLGDEHGPVAFYLLPYLEPEVVRALRQDASLRGHEAATASVLDGVKKHAAAEGHARTVAVAHAFVSGGQVSESERPLSVGGAGTVDARLFEGLSYTALGHLHRPQSLGEGRRVHYSGSLMKYSFDEVDHRKGVSIVELGADGAVQVESVDLTPPRDVVRVQGRFEELLKEARFEHAVPCYVEATLTDEGYVPDPMVRLRQRFPHLLNVRRLALELALDQDVSERRRLETDELALFQQFYKHVRGTEADEERIAVFKHMAEAVRHEERNA